MDSTEQESTRRDALRTLGSTLGALTIGTASLTWRSILPAAAQETDAEGEAEGEGGGGDEGLTPSQLFAFLHSLELSTVAAYDRAIAGGQLTPHAAVLTQHRLHHAEHAKMLEGVAGSDATGGPNPILSQVTDDQMEQAPSPEALLRILYDLETAMAATKLNSLGSLPDPDQARLVAGILPAESQQAVVLGRVLGLAANVVVPPFEVVERAMPPETFPLEEAK